jgi:hypothetical protein
MADGQNGGFGTRLREVFIRTLPKLEPEAASQLAELITPQSLSIIGGVLAIWVVGHAFGYGEAIDIVLGAAGLAAVGVSAFAGLDELYLFARQTYSADGEAAFDQAADHLAKAISILGIQTVLALLLRGRSRGARRTLPSGPKNPGMRYEPSITRDPKLPAGQGMTTFWGDITVSTAGSADEQALVLLHEKVHQFLSPKFFKLRQFRVRNRVSSYFGSSLYRYIEEALAETIAQIGVNGLSKFFLGLRFPVDNGYVFITHGGGFSPAMAGRGIFPEGVTLFASGSIQGFAYKIWFKAGFPTSSDSPR